MFVAKFPAEKHAKLGMNRTILRKTSKSRTGQTIFRRTRIAGQPAIPILYLISHNQIDYNTWNRPIFAEMTLDLTTMSADAAPSSGNNLAVL